jgi:hypothetical protein
LGCFNEKRARNELIKGNLAILHVQAVAVGGVAGLISWLLGTLFHAEQNTFHESMLMLASGTWCAAGSSLLLGVFMSAVVALSKRFHVNPDNVATPMAASLGDLVTIVMLIAVSMALYAVKGASLAVLARLKSVLTMLFCNRHAREYVLLRGSCAVCACGDCVHSQQPSGAPLAKHGVDPHHSRHAHYVVRGVFLSLTFGLTLFSQCFGVSSGAISQPVPWFGSVGACAERSSALLPTSF